MYAQTQKKTISESMVLYAYHGLTHNNLGLKIKCTDRYKYHLLITN